MDLAVTTSSGSQGDSFLEPSGALPGELRAARSRSDAIASHLSRLC